jgi:hypothetical protein
VDVRRKPLLYLCRVENMSAVEELRYFLLGAKDVERNGAHHVHRLFNLLEAHTTSGARHFGGRRRHHHGVVKLLQQLIKPATTTTTTTSTLSRLWNRIQGG